MANYCGVTRTNYFRVKDEEKYKELFSHLRGDEDDVQDFTETDEENVVWHGFGTYGCLEYVPDEDEEPADFDDFLKELQKVVAEDDAVIIMEAGHEKMRYVCGIGHVVTSKGIEYVSLKWDCIDKACEMLGNPNFMTQCEY